MCDVLCCGLAVSKERGRLLNLESFTPMSELAHLKRTCGSRRTSLHDLGLIASGLGYLNTVNQTAHYGIESVGSQK